MKAKVRNIICIALRFLLALLDGTANAKTSDEKK